MRSWEEHGRVQSFWKAIWQHAIRSLKITLALLSRNSTSGNPSEGNNQRIGQRFLLRGSYQSTQYSELHITEHSDVVTHTKKLLKAMISKGILLARNIRGHAKRPP